MNKEIIRTPPSAELEELFRQAHVAKHRSYSPYSNFRVGAALITSDGIIYSGCNIENAAHTPSVCAERTAIVKAVSEGHCSFRTIAITSDVEDGFVSPCGVCRQMIAEFGFGIDIYLVNPKNESKKYTMQELLPDAFTIDDLKKRHADHDVVE